MKPQYVLVSDVKPILEALQVIVDLGHNNDCDFTNNECECHVDIAKNSIDWARFKFGEKL
jgi:hypothetical protein